MWEAPCRSRKERKSDRTYPASVSLKPSARRTARYSSSAVRRFFMRHLVARAAPALSTLPGRPSRRSRSYSEVDALGFRRSRPGTPHGEASRWPRNASEGAHLSESDGAQLARQLASRWSRSLWSVRSLGEEPWSG